MRITLAFNLRQSQSEEQAELLTDEDVDRLLAGLRSLGHMVTPVEVTAPGEEVVDRLVRSQPDLIFNVAEGTGSSRAREAFYPALYDQLGLPFTGGGSSLLLVDLDKRLAEKLLNVQGIRVPKGRLLTRESPELPVDLPLPAIVKPNFEGSSKGITQDSIVDSRRQAERQARTLLEQYPEGVLIEEFVQGRELTVPMLEAYPGQLLEIVEHRFPEAGEHNIYDYDTKRSETAVVEVCCPPELEPSERAAVLELAARAFEAMRCPDLGRVDVRLQADGTPCFIEVNPLPALGPGGSLSVAAKARGLDLRDVLALVVRSAAQRYGLPLSMNMADAPLMTSHPRVGCRDLGLRVGRFEPGEHDAITDVAGLRVGHVTKLDDARPLADGSTTSVCTGVTAVVPEIDGDLFHNHLVAGGFVLNGIGEMSGLIQAMEWGWLETPILLTNTMSLGHVHSGIIEYMVRRHPELGRRVDVIIPLVAETNDAFLNDVRVTSNSAADAIAAIEAARLGPVEQGSVGGGTGMITFDFAGGIGSASRVLPRSLGGYTVGVLVQSNFGKMRNMTVDGAVIGRALDPMYPMEGRRQRDTGSIIVVIATDAPMLSEQLSRLSKRAALGLGRVGSFASATSGEIAFAFSTANRLARIAKEREQRLMLEFVPDEHLNGLYEATVEATEAAVLNAMLCSRGMRGREGRFAPPAPAEAIVEAQLRCRPPGLAHRRG